MTTATSDAPAHTQVLRAVGTGGFIGGLLACFFLGWWGVVIALGIFFGSAILDGVIDAVKHGLRKP